ncbi:unnamed protein product [Protopolystoma xenopodis]|uniref:Uncharacterized protein n=1 Tax=Protopolystoma xenopodis TaxID=117903 RepID=A0A3S5BQ75_9PLAT|nr:unnamed protein product [Protopolystoma xenopodis]
MLRIGGSARAKERLVNELTFESITKNGPDNSRHWCPLICPCHVYCFVPGCIMNRPPAGPGRHSRLDMPTSLACVQEKNNLSRTYRICCFFPSPCHWPNFSDRPINTNSELSQSPDRPIARQQGFTLTADWSIAMATQAG